MHIHVHSQITMAPTSLPQCFCPPHIYTLQSLSSFFWTPNIENQIVSCSHYQVVSRHVLLLCSGFSLTMSTVRGTTYRNLANNVVSRKGATGLQSSRDLLGTMQRDLEGLSQLTLVSWALKQSLVPNNAQSELLSK